MPTCPTYGIHKHTCPPDCGEPTEPAREFNTEADLLNNAIAAFEDALAEHGEIRTELNCQLDGGQVVRLVWKATGRASAWKVCVVTTPGEEPRELRTTPLVLRIQLVDHFDALAKAARNREAEIVGQIKSARTTIASVTTQLLKKKTK